jgi:uncharacterized membrane protein YgdD (TMEM256/DUF423 family)
MKFPLQISLVLGALGVAIGAFGAHALAPILEETGKSDTWNTGMQYYWIHTLAMVALAASPLNPLRVQRTTWIWIGSMALFSGSLFALALGGPSWMGAITPIGGVGFIVGWLQLLWLREST